MMKVIEMTGKNVDEAVQAALKELNVVREQVDVEILETSGKKYFGFFGDKLAKVRVTVIRESKIKQDVNIGVVVNSLDSPVLPQEKISPKDQIREDNTTNELSEQRKEKRDKPREYRQERPIKSAKNNESIVEKEINETAVSAAKSFLENVFQSMDLDVVMEKSINDGIVTFNLHGSDLGILIGKHGQTLDSLQYLANLVANKDIQDRTRFVVDIENYRQRRVETLMVLAKKLASQVKRTHEKVTLEPMTPHERKVIHMALQDDHRVTTNSEGEEPHRYIVIELR